MLFFINNVFGSSLTTLTYQSTTQNTSCKMNIYLPDGYDLASDSVNYYPVFYLIHGGGENYTHWANSGNAKAILDEYISAGKAVPMILVMPDAKNLDAPVFTKELLNDIIPYIEKNYRVKTDKDNRGVGGLSWGGLQAMDAGIYHYEMFGYLSVLSSGWFTTDNAAYTKARNFLSANGKDMEKSIRYFYFGEGTSSDIAYNNGQATLKLFRDSGLTVHYWEHYGGHTWQAWKEDLKSFLPFLFRDSTTVYVSKEYRGGNINNVTIMTNVDSLIDVPEVPARTGYSFVGWYKDPACVEEFRFETDTIKKNTTIYAKWNVNSYKISFDSNGGSIVDDTVVSEYNTLIKAPVEPIKSGYIFNGWYYNSEFSKKWDFATDKVSKDITLIARWMDSTSVSVKSKNASGVNVFPNPASSELQLKNLPSEAVIAIFSQDGRQLMLKKSENSDYIVNTTAFPSGVYQLKISSAHINFSQPIVVKH